MEQIMGEERGYLEPHFATIKWWKWGKGNVCLKAPSITINHVEMWKWKGLPRASFCYHKMVQIGDRKGIASNRCLISIDLKSRKKWKGLL